MFNIEGYVGSNFPMSFSSCYSGVEVKIVIKTDVPDTGQACELKDHLVTLLKTVLDGSDPVCSVSFDIDKVWYNIGRKGISTTVLWKDGTKTTVTKLDDEVEDPEKSLAMCYAKKALGNKGNYYNSFRHFLPIMTEQIDKKEKKQDEISEE